MKKCNLGVENGQDACWRRPYWKMAAAATLPPVDNWHHRKYWSTHSYDYNDISQDKLSPKLPRHNIFLLHAPRLNKMLIFSLSSEQLSMCGYFLYYNYMNWQHCLNACVLHDNIVNDQIYCSPGKVCEHRKEITRKCFMVFLVAVGL